jgi:uncharacterized protein (TIGR00255 family)
MRKLTTEKISRGKVDIFVTQNLLATNDVVANFNHNLGDTYIKCLREIRDRYDIRDDISVSLIARLPEVIVLNHQEDDLEETWSRLCIPLNEALESLISMRIREGLKLKEDILKRCDFTKELLDKISQRAPQIVSEYKEKLEKRIKELLDNVPLDESRVAVEVAIFADKSNIDEEIVRLNSHINQMKETLNLDEPVGRKLDFIVQEMNREANTIASKADDLELVNIALGLKNEIEKIREQVQNIE